MEFEEDLKIVVCIFATFEKYPICERREETKFEEEPRSQITRALKLLG